MSIPIVQVDAFAAAPFTGNPAAVCILDQPADARWMQNVALEMNLSETAFLWREDDGYRLRWFTPQAEVDLCGHATLASAHVLWEDGHLRPDETARFATRSGTLLAERRAAGAEDFRIWMDFPATPVEPVTDTPERAAVLAALGCRASFVGKNRFDWLVALADEDAVAALAPDLSALARTPARGVIVTAPAATDDVDFVSRFFAPAVGVPEDPVTGSAHCALAPYWAAKLGRDEMKATQASQRGGEVRVVVAGERVKLGGHAVTTLRGELCDCCTPTAGRHPPQ